MLMFASCRSTKPTDTNGSPFTRAKCESERAEESNWHGCCYAMRREPLSRSKRGIGLYRFIVTARKLRP